MINHNTLIFDIVSGIIMKANIAVTKRRLEKKNKFNYKQMHLAKLLLPFRSRIFPFTNTNISFYEYEYLSLTWNGFDGVRC